MVNHWRRKEREDPTYDRAKLQRSKAINAFGACFTFVVLVIVLYSKFTHGAYIVVIAMPLLFMLMRAIHRHYEWVAEEIHVGEVRSVMPARNHAVVLVSSLSVPTVRALDYARSINTHSLPAVNIV